MDSVDLIDLERIVTERAQILAPATFNTEMAVLRRWCEFHHLDPREREVRDVLQFKKATPTRLIVDSDILTPNDVITLIQHLRTPAWKALIAIMWDTGCRIGEICGLDYVDVTRDEHGFVLHIRHSKTMKRKLRLITPEIGLKYFTSYYIQHQGSGSLFQTSSGTRITSNVVRKILSQAKVGKHLGKRVWPTLFRKSAPTYWKKSGMLPDPAIRQRLGHRNLIGPSSLPRDFERKSLGEKYEILMDALRKKKNGHSITKEWSNAYFTKLLYEYYIESQVLC